MREALDRIVAKALEAFSGGSAAEVLYTAFQSIAEAWISFLRQLEKALNESEFGAFLRWYQSVTATGKSPV